MRPLEALLLALLALRAAAAALPRAAPARPDVARPLASLLLVAALAAHLAVEGGRWQLLPAYAAALALPARDLLARVRAAAPRRRRPATRAGRSLTAVAATALLALPAALLPVPALPAPSGPWPVGSDAFELELGAPEAGGGGRLRARVWYPAAPGADPAAHPPAPWLEHLDGMLPALAEGAGLPAWAVGHLRHVAPHARWGAPPREGAPLPVATFDHGRGGFAAQNTYLAEELASHGWLVLAPEHPGGALRTEFRDGEAVAFDPAAFGAGLEGAAYDAAIRALGRRWIAETRAALAALRDGAGPAQLRGRVDGRRLAALGHSTGGGVAYGVCAAEPACGEAVGLDPWMLPVPPALLGPPPAGGLRADLRALFSDPALGFFEPPNRAAFDRLAAASAAAGSEVEAVVLEGAGHNGVTDVALLTPLGEALGLNVGRLPPGRALPAVREAVLAWLGPAPR